MRRRLLWAVGALALGWSSAHAQEGAVQPGTAKGVGTHDVGAVKTQQETHGFWDFDGNLPRGTIVGGLGVYFIQPNFESNAAFQTTTSIGGVTILRRHDFRYDMDAAPSAWIGWVNDCGFGARLRWFLYDQGAHEETINPGDTTIRSASPIGIPAIVSSKAGNRFSADSGLAVQTFDFELTQSVPGCCDWDLVVAGGIRYAHVAQTYNAFGTTTPVAAVLPSAGILSGHNFNGAGPTIALEGRRRFGCSGFALYGNLRGSLLFGSAEAQAFRTATAGGVTTITHDSATQQSDVLPIGEIEVGAEYVRGFGRACGVLQVGL